MSIQPRTADLLELLERALSMARARHAQTPDYGLYSLICKQLEAALSVLNKRRVPTPAEKRRMTVGLLAAKELEAADPDFADLLMRVDHLFKRLGS